MLFFLLVYDQKTSAASKVLGVYCLVLGLAFFLPFITYGVANDLLNPLAAWLFFLPVLYGSLLYLYCRKVVFNAPFKAADLIHFTPLIICYALNVDALFSLHEETRLWIVGAAAPTLRMWLSEYILFAVGIVYLAATALLIRRYHQQASNTLSNFNPTIFLWLSALVVSFVVIFLVKGIMAFSNFATLTMLVLSDAMIVGIIYLIALRQWKNPRFFVINSHGDEQLPSQSEVSSEAKSHGAIDTQTRAVMFDELILHIEQERSYRNSKLNLATLADSVGLSPHHLSEVLNQHAGQNFNHFINDYRVKEVCEELNSATTSSVLDIALQAGFSSKSTFNTIFKKFTGLTPTQYRKQSQV